MCINSDVRILVPQWFRFELVGELDAISRPDGHERSRSGFHVVHGGRPRRRTPPTVWPPVHAPSPPTSQPRSELSDVAHARGHTQVSSGSGAPVGRLASRGRIIRPATGARTEPAVVGAAAKRASTAAERGNQLQRHGARTADERTEPVPPPGPGVTRPVRGAQAPGTTA